MSAHEVLLVLATFLGRGFASVSGHAVVSGVPYLAGARRQVVRRASPVAGLPLSRTSAAPAVAFTQSRVYGSSKDRSIGGLGPAETPPLT